MLTSFESVLPDIEHQIARDQALTSQLWSRVSAVTVIRDATGLVRFLIEPSQPLREDDNGVLELKKALSKTLGAYFGNDVWFTQRHFAMLGSLISVVRNDRVPAPWDVANAQPRWYLVERHVAKHLWTTRITRQPPWPVDPVERGQRPAVVTFFSFKGGIGRTTCLAGTAIALARNGHRVAVVDLDLEAPGLSTLFVADVMPDPGVLDYLIEKRVQKDAWSLRPSLRQVNNPAAVGATGQPLRLLSAGTVDKNYLEKLARIDFQHLTDVSLSALLVDMLRELGSAVSGLDFILLDARAGFHDLGGFALAALSHGAVLIAGQNRQTWAGIAHAVRLLATPSVEDRLPVVLVHGMAPSPGTPGREQTLKQFRERAYDVFQEYYYAEDEDTPNSNDTDAPFAPVELFWQSEFRNDILLTPRDDTPEERSRAEALSAALSASCEPIAAKLCRLFGRSFIRSETERG